MNYLRWSLPIFFLTLTCLANQRVWLVRCTTSGTSLNELQSELSRQGVNVLNSIERSDPAITHHCGAGEKLQAFHLWEFQKSMAKGLALGLRDAPEDFKPQPPRKVH